MLNFIIKINIKFLSIIMKKISLIIFMVLLTYFFLPNKIKAETALDVYMNDFYDKSNEAKKLLKEIEITLKEGSRNQVCSRQRRAAKLGLLANDSLIKAFQISGKEPPMEAIKANELRWKSILNEC